MIFSVFSTVGIVLLGICSNIVSEDTDRITSTSQGLILPLMIKRKAIFYHRADKEEMRKRGIYLE